MAEPETLAERMQKLERETAHVPPEGRAYRLYNGTIGTYKEALEEAIRANEAQIAKIQERLDKQRAELVRIGG